MPGKTRFTLTTTAVLTVFILSAMWTVPAFADDSTPPPVETPTEAAPPADEPADEAIPLASEEASNPADIVDPMWCPAGVTPFSAGCSTDYASLNALVADVGGALNPTKSGTIWIEAGNEASGNPIIFDKDTNAAFTTWSAFDLTFKGGWSGLANQTINTSTPSRISEQLYIDWVGAITLNDLVITATANDAGTYYALQVTTSRNILLERVTVEDANNSNVTGTYHGAYLDNTAGLGNVTINNSNFQGNEGHGLFVYSDGLITTNNLTANLNGGVGAVLDNRTAATDKAVLMKGLKQFNNNGDRGLSIYSDGLVTLSNVVANNNASDGVYVDNTTSLTSQGVTVVGTNYFLNNTGDGLAVWSHGVITANNINASDNNGDGAYLNNCDDNGSDCTVTFAKLVKLSGVNTFNNNGDDGLDIYSFGAISLNSVTATNNAFYGAYVDNGWDNYLFKESVGTVTLTGYNIFNDNNDYGLQVFSHGNMLLNNLTASDNGYDGVALTADKNVGSASVTIKGASTFNNNNGNGLYIDADGKVTLGSLTANVNTGSGAELYASDPGMGVTLTGANTFTYNSVFGLYVVSQGAITASSVTASYNSQYGAGLYNAFDALKPFNVTLTGNNSFNGNDDMGLEVATYGTILINNLTANDNGLVALQGYGASLDNCFWNGSACDTITPKAVTLTGSVNTNGNYYSGLYIDSLGAITLTNVSASGNGNWGAEIYNDYNNLKPMNVTFKGSNTFNDNGNDGLLIYSYGAIALNNVTANWNGGNGTVLDNFRGNTSITAKTITLTGVNSFVGNYYDGLYFNASGSVILNRVNADWNTDMGGSGYSGSGIKGTAHTGSITLVCGHTFLNEGYGYDLTALVGPIFIKGIYSYANILGDFADGTAETITKACALP